MSGKKRNWREMALNLLRLQTRGEILRTVLGGLFGALFYVALYQLDLPSFRLMGVITVQLDPAILAIPVIAAFLGPLAGLIAGLAGSTMADALFTQQVIALGLINVSFGLLGFIAGIPHDTQGFSSGRALAKVVLFTMAGFIVMALVYLGALLFISHQNMLPTLLYNFLPFFTVSLITLFLVTPVAVRIIDALANYAWKKHP
jgi:uncharacterized membrane protein